MHNLFNPENKFFTIMGRVADIMILNLLCVICSIPVVTIGSAFTATYYMTLKIVRDEDSYIVKGFFHSFIQNLKQSIGINIIMILIGSIIGFDIYFARIMQTSNPAFKILTYVFLCFALVFCMVLTYVYPLLAKFDNTIRHTLKNALIMSIRHLPYTLLMLIISALPLILVLFVPKVIPMVMMFMILFGFGAICWLHSFFFVKIFDKYIPSADSGNEDGKEDMEIDSDEANSSVEELESNIFPPCRPVEKESEDSEIES